MGKGRTEEEGGIYRRYRFWTHKEVFAILQIRMNENLNSNGNKKIDVENLSKVGLSERFDIGLVVVAYRGFKLGTERKEYH